MVRLLSILVLFAALPGCARLAAILPGQGAGAPATVVAEERGAEGAARPVPRPSVPAPETASPSMSAVAGLGDPSDPGLWVKTPLVSMAAPGRVALAAGGAAIEVELRPAGSGAPTQLSLQAMQALGAPITSLPEVTVSLP